MGDFMLTIKREQQAVDADISYHVIINQIDMCTLENGQMKNLDLKNGDYKIQIKSSRFVSQEIPFSMAEKTQIEFVCTPSYKNTTWSIFLHKTFKKNRGILLKLTQDIYL